ncbi:hypothetical protein BH09SUM1_BH09SUM1_16490 [soil metagenome]
MRSGVFLRKISSLFALMAFALMGVIGEAQPFDHPNRMTDAVFGPVNAMATSGTLLYLGGDFGYLGPKNAGLANLDLVSGMQMAAADIASRAVNCMAPDGMGGCYVAGLSSAAIGTTYNYNLAHILSDGSVDPAWAPVPGGEVSLIAVSGQRVYVYGLFSTINGTSRHGLAALDAETGEVLPWNPEVTGHIQALAASDTTVYVGGIGIDLDLGFTLTGSLLALDAITGGPRISHPLVPSGSIYTMLLDGPTLYPGGDFAVAGGASRKNLAALNADTGDATAWNPGRDDYVFALAANSSTVYVGGSIVNSGAQEQGYLIAVDKITAVAKPWNLSINGRVDRAIATESRVYFGGRFFTSVNGQYRRIIAAVDAESGELLPWNPLIYGASADQRPLSFVLSDSALFIGGYFSSLGGQLRERLAAVDMKTGRATSWNPGADKAVLALAVEGPTVYAGGRFAVAGGRPREYIAAINGQTGAATEWDPGTSGYSVNALAAAGGKVYVGGAFTDMGGEPRNDIAQIEETTGTVTIWNPDADGRVSTIVPSGDTIYVGGDFTQIGGAARGHIAALNFSDGVATEWNPGADDSVNAILLTASAIYVGGRFSSIGGQSRSGLASLDPVSGLASEWNPSTNPPGDFGPGVSALTLLGGNVYAGGDFTMVGGRSQNYVAEINAQTGEVSPWDPQLADGDVQALATGSFSLYCGGRFTSVGQEYRGALAEFDDLSPLGDRWVLH